MSTTTLRQDCRAQPVPEATDLVLHTEPVGEETEAWEDVNGTAMFTCHYKAVQEPPRATLVLVHGFGEHCMRYVAVCRTFASQGIEVLTYDQRGFGRTGRKNNQMGVTRGIQQLQRDMTFMNRRVRRAATASQPAIPHFVLGHSMGGMEVLSYILQCPEETAELITGAIVTSSAIQLAPDAQPNPVMRIISKVASTLFKSVTIRRPLNLERLSRDPAVGQAVRHDEYYYLIGSLQCLDELLNMGTVLLKHDLQEVTTPILLTHGDADEIVDINGTADMFKALPDTMDKQFNIAPGGYHELHNEPNRRDVIELWIKWIHKHAEVASA